MVAFLKAVRGDAVISPVAILTAIERDGLHPDVAVALLDYLAAGLDAGSGIVRGMSLKLRKP